MNDPDDVKEHAETQVLERDDDEPELDPEATAVLGEEYRRKIESGT